MRNIKLTIEYDGTNYCGWQRQPRTKTVVGELQKAVKRVLRENPRIEYSSRTDSGVHSFGQTVNFHTISDVPVKNILRGLNAVLPDDISVTCAVSVNKDFNARFDVKSKLYKYVICDSNIPPAVNRHFIYHFRLGRLDVARMQRGARFLVGKHDFSSFGVNDRVEYDSPVKTITKIQVKREDGLICIYVRGSSFLYKMVRSIVGTLILVGRGRIQPEDVKKILAAKNRASAGPTAPPHGLFLMKTYY